MPDPQPMPLDEEPISLDDSEDEALGLEEEGATSSKVRAIGADHGLGVKEHAYKRTLNVNGQGATRCRVWHSKIADASLKYMEDQINDWLDSEDVEIKAVSQCIGTMEGKTPVPNLIVLVWY